MSSLSSVRCASSEADRRCRRTGTWSRGAVGRALLVVEHVRQAEGVAELVGGGALEVDRRGIGVDVGVVDREAVLTGVELDVDVEDRARLVEAGGELGAAVGAHDAIADVAGDVGDAVAVDVVAVVERGVPDQGDVGVLAMRPKLAGVRKVISSTMSKPTKPGLATVPVIFSSMYEVGMLFQESNAF